MGFGLATALSGSVFRDQDRWTAMTGSGDFWGFYRRLKRLYLKVGKCLMDPDGCFGSRNRSCLLADDRLSKEGGQYADGKRAEYMYDTIRR